MRFSIITVAAAAGVTFSLQGGLTVGVDYHSPELDTPDAWAASVSDHTRKGSDDLQTWWKGFKDPTLNELIDRTRDANLTLKVAAQSIAEARALRGIARSRLLPTAAADGELLRNRASESLLAPSPENPSTLYSAGFDAGWEIDVFGGIRRGIEAAAANIGASMETYRDLLVTLYAETALNYIEYRTLENRIAIAKQNIAAQEDTVQLTEDRFAAELVPKIDVTQAKTNLQGSRGLLPILRTQLTFAKNRIATLTGGYPQSVEKLLARNRPIPVPRKGYSAGLPADLIRSRPDVRAAERRLAAQTARIGIAEADLYPRFALSGDFQLQTVDSSTFWDSASRAYSFGPNFRWQVFSGGRIRASIDAQEARTEQALAGYEQSVLVAVEEVETSMAAIANGWDLIATLDLAVESAVETMSLVKDSYTEGLIDFQRVLDAERVRFTTQEAASVAHGQIAKSYVALYKSLGGGSEVKVIPVAAPKTQANSLLSRIGKRKPKVDTESAPEQAD